MNKLPEDSESLKVVLRSLIQERDRERQRAQEQAQRADDLHLQNLRLQLELERLRKWYYGPRADRLETPGDLAQALLDFAQELEQRPIQSEDLPPHTPPEPEYELRRVKRRRGRRNLANFENLPVTTHVYELNPQEQMEIVGALGLLLGSLSLAVAFLYQRTQNYFQRLAVFRQFIQIWFFAKHIL